MRNAIWQYWQTETKLLIHCNEKEHCVKNISALMHKFSEKIFHTFITFLSTVSRFTNAWVAIKFILTTSMDTRIISAFINIWVNSSYVQPKMPLNSWIKHLIFWVLLEIRGFPISRCILASLYCLLVGWSIIWSVYPSITLLSKTKEITIFTKLMYIKLIVYFLVSL